MKPISEMNLSECLDAIKEMKTPDIRNLRHRQLAVRIHELTRWIPVSERLPKDGTPVRVWETGEERRGTYIAEIDEWIVYGRGGDIRVTHWQPITPPEGA